MMEWGGGGCCEVRWWRGRTPPTTVDSLLERSGKARLAAARERRVRMWDVCIVAGLNSISWFYIVGAV